MTPRPGMTRRLFPGIELRPPHVEEPVTKVDGPDSCEKPDQFREVRRSGIGSPRGGETDCPARCCERRIEAETRREKQQSGEVRLDKRDFKRTFPT